MSDKRKARQSAASAAILRVVLEILESDGYEGVKVREVAARSRVSMSTIYKLFGTREEVIVAALALWIETKGYSRLQGPVPDLPFAEGQLWAFRQVFEPWQRHPQMLEAFCRARALSGGSWLDGHGREVIQPAMQKYFGQLDPEYAADVALVLEYFTCHAFARVANGKMPVSEIVPLLERAVHLVTADNQDLAAGKPKPSTRSTAQ